MYHERTGIILYHLKKSSGLLITSGSLFTGVGIEGGCPAEKDNAGCYYFTDGREKFVPILFLSVE